MKTNVLAFPAVVRRRVGRRSLVSALFSFGMVLGFPTTGAYQDIGSLVSGADAALRWTTFVQRSAAGSVQAADLPFGGQTILSGAGRKAEGIGTVGFRDRTAKGTAGAAASDESRVVRAGKRGRLLRVAPMAPPKNFSAGSVFERTSSLLRPAVGPEVAMAFALPGIKGREERIASAFHPKAEPAPQPGMPALLAALVTNAGADVLATAYAPPAPDYEKDSPFESLLGGEPARGRFIPPIEPGDHAWMATPLPPSVFSPAEQKCLATGIYFEARGEKLRGQAAVAQVILNRVRNPAYPKSICGVVYQNQHMRNACQFSFACDGIPDRIASPAAYRTAQDVALAVTAGKIFLPEIASSTHYYADYVSPRWARAMEKMKKIGRHIFFRTYGGGWN